MHSVHPTPKFSVITVTYNAEKVLEDTIQSVIAQTYHHVEYIMWTEPPKMALYLSSTDTAHGYILLSANRTRDCMTP